MSILHFWKKKVICRQYALVKETHWCAKKRKFHLKIIRRKKRADRSTNFSRKPANLLFFSLALDEICIFSLFFFPAMTSRSSSSAKQEGGRRGKWASSVRVDVWSVRKERPSQKECLLPSACLPERDVIPKFGWVTSSTLPREYRHKRKYLFLFFFLF